MKSSSGGIRQRSFGKVSVSFVFGGESEEEHDSVTEQWATKLGTIGCPSFPSWTKPALSLPVYFVL